MDKNLNLKGIKPVRFSRLPPSRDPDIVGKGGIPPGAGNQSPECPPSPRLQRTIRRSSPSLKASASEGGCLGCAMCAVICPDCCIEVYK